LTHRDREGESVHRIRILHVSDVHFRAADDSLSEARLAQVRREAWRRHRILGPEFREEIRRIASTAPVDVVCFTGDAADWGLGAEFDVATGFLQQLTHDAGVSPDRLFVIPGNHDVDRGVGAASWTRLRDLVRTLGERALSDWIAGGPAPLGVDASLDRDTLERQRAYRDWLHRLSRPELLPEHSPHRQLGYRIELTPPHLPFPLHVIGLDSAWLAGDDHDEGKLMLTQDQIGRLCTNDRGEPLAGFRLTLVHHPLMQLADSGDAKRLLAQYADLVLRGHQHEPLVDVWRDPDRGLIELAAGCLYDGGAGHRFPNGYSVIDAITDDHGRPERYEVQFRSWSERGHWHDNGALYRSAPHGRLTIPVGSPVDLDPPLEARLRAALVEQWDNCRRARVPVQTFHKLLAVCNASRPYVRDVFDSVGPSVFDNVFAWLTHHVQHHAAASEKTDSDPIDIDSDRTIAAARALADTEGRHQVDARHVLMAILADAESNTVAELRKTLDTFKPDGFAEVQIAARNVVRHFLPRASSNLASLRLKLSGDE
jgi:predicted MPP superfamily phosphohydrolase